MMIISNFFINLFFIQLFIHFIILFIWLYFYFFRFININFFFLYLLIFLILFFQVIILIIFIFICLFFFFIFNLFIQLVNFLSISLNFVFKCFSINDFEYIKINYSVCFLLNIKFFLSEFISNKFQKTVILIFSINIPSQFFNSSFIWFITFYLISLCIIFTLSFSLLLFITIIKVNQHLMNIYYKLNTTN